MKRTAVVREIRESSEDELRGRLSRLETQLFKLRLKHSTNQIENISQIRTTRREIARVLTVMAERRRAKQPDAQQS
ncbi:50S ribosomal protein L29 [Haliangium sp. UPWRP_2]|uniref:50S ribosomal protein L29 n=1 Tax=Haliangium sp. UPWRP_2 TaxID=1931276 RepID=UPI000B543B1D|nr:50S ribosomal protein L29 [Haliangium sp. UPWRP_2]PSM32433.1 50S ribosomal protein L29 [Haliangium sp. UPWRP_2]